MRKKERAIRGGMALFLTHAFSFARNAESNENRVLPYKSFCRFSAMTRYLSSGAIFDRYLSMSSIVNSSGFFG